MSKLSLDARSQNNGVKKPKELIVYSVDDDRNLYINSQNQLRYYYFPISEIKKKYDLKSGFDKFKIRDRSKPSHIDNLLKSIMYYEKNMNGGKRIKADFITFRGIMKSLMVLPYTRMNYPWYKCEGFIFNVKYFDGQIFLEIDHENFLKTQEKPGFKSKLDPKVYEYFGYKFETLASLSKPWAESSREEISNRDKEVVSNISEYCTIVRTGVGNFKTILGAEVDGIYDYSPKRRFPMKNQEDAAEIKELFDKKPSGSTDDLSHYVELKTQRGIYNDKDAKRFEIKLLSTWAQSFLVGTQHVVYGFRDDNGILQSVEEYKTDEVPRMVARSKFLEDESKWNGNECIAFYSAVLEWIKDTIPHDETQTWRLQYVPGETSLRLYRMNKEDEKRIGDFLLPEFVSWRKSLD